MQGTEKSRISSGKVRSRFQNLIVQAVAIVALAIGPVSCGGGGGGDDDGAFTGVTTVTGKAFVPVSQVNDPNPFPLGKGIVTLIDFADQTTTRNLRTTVVGETDDDGNFTVQAPGQPVIAIVVNGTVEGQDYRTSGLVQAGRSSVNRNFNAETDIACEAMIGAINRGEQASNTVTQSQIDNLESAARLEVPNVDFTNPDSVSAASRRVAAATSNGTIDITVPAPEPTDDTGTLNCQSSETTCADGFPICAELFCNGTVDCADGSDEDVSVCSEQSSCCSATNGCPGETGSSCTDECCCCGFGEACNQGDFANGCVATASRTTGRESALSKLISTGVYY